MRKLLVLIALSLSTSAAWAQAEKAAPVTKLPGEENLSTRERAERDFLMPVRRKKAAELTKPTASAEQMATAAPETDAIAHYNEAAADPRTEEAGASAHESAARATRHATWLAARRAHLFEARALKASRAARRTTKASKSSKTAKATKASRAKATKHSAKATHHTAAKATRTHTTAAKHSAHKATKAAAKHSAHKATKSKTKVKKAGKPAAKHKRRR